MLVLEPQGRRRAPRRALRRAEPRAAATRRSSPTAMKGELWVGPRLGVPQSRARYGVDECRAALPSSPGTSAALDGAATRAAPGAPRASAPASTRRSPSATRDKELAAALVRDAPPQGRARDRASCAAVIASTQARLRGRHPRRCAAAQSEREVEGVFNLRARVEGNDVGYGTIAAVRRARLHPALDATTTAALEPGDLLLLDAGVEGHSLYTADITRTLPICGQFSPEQREIYELVHAAQQAALRGGQAGQRLHGAEPRGDARPRRGPRAPRHPADDAEEALDGREPVLQALLAPQRQPHARPRRARLRAGARRRPTSSASSSRAWCSPSSRASTSSATT